MPIVVGYVAVLSAVIAGQADAGDRLRTTIRAEMAARGPIVTPEDRALIAAKCGYGADTVDRNSVNMQNGALICADGKRVDDAETRAMSQRISARARVVADRAMRSAAVAKAKADVAREAARRAVERR